MLKRSTSLFVLFIVISALTFANSAALSSLNLPAESGAQAAGALEPQYWVYLPLILKDYYAIAAISQSTSTNEEAPQTITLSGTGGSGNSLTFVIIGNPLHGSLGSLGTVNCTGVPPACTVDVVYTPALDYFGPDSFTFKVNDGTHDSSIATVDITIEGINDLPSFTKGSDQAVNEDAGAQTVASWATAISAGPGEDAQVVNFVIDSNDNPTLFSAGPAVAANGTLTYTPAANKNGVANITLHIHDDGGTANGGVDSSATQSFTITVNPVNDAPVAQTKTASAQTNMKIVGINAGLLAGVTDADSGINGCNPTFTIASITSGSGGSVSNVNLTAGTFDFDPNPGFTGTAVVNYTVQDNGCPGSATSAPAAINITVSGPVIWFVNPAVPGPGDGRLSNPFKYLSGNGGAANDADDVDASGHRIFVYSGSASGGITLNSDEWLIGSGVSGTTFDALFGITPPAGTIARPNIAQARPVIMGKVTLATSDVLRGLNIQPPSGIEGLTASTATSLTVNETSVTTANAAAVNLSSSGGAISLTSVNANGGSRGILLNSTTGSFTVTGTGGTCTAGNTSGCSGGVIQNMSGADDSSATPTGTGIVLNNAASVSLTRMWIHDHSNYAMRLTSVSGFTLDNSVINGANGGSTAASAGSPFNDSSIYFTNLAGSATVSNTSISGGFSNNVKLVNNTGTLDRLTFSSVTIGANSTTDGNDGIGIEGQGAAVVKVTVQNSTFTSARGDLFQMNHIGTGTADLVFTGNSLSNNHPAIATGGGGVTLGNGSSSTFTMNLTANTFRDAVGHAILIVKDIGAGSQSVTFSNNTVGVAGVANSGSREGSDLKIQQAGDGTQTVLISGNNFYQYNNDALLLQTGAGIAKGGTFNATVTGNLISNAGNNPSIAVPIQGISLNGGVTPGDNFSICLAMGGAGAQANDLDSAAGAVNGSGDYRLRQRQNTTVRLPGYAGGATDTNAVVVFVNGNNIVSGSGTATASGTGGGFVGGAACTLP